MSDFNIYTLLAAPNFSLVRSLFRAELDKGGNWAEKYTWLHEATITSDVAIAALLQDRIGSALEDQPLAFDPCLFDEHLNEISARLTACLSRQREMDELEAQAITVAMDYLLSESLQTGTLQLAGASLAADVAMAPPHGDLTSGVLEKQDGLQTKIRDARLLMHATPGNGLNYGERLRFLRSLQAEDLLITYQRLQAAQRGLVRAKLVGMRKIPMWSEKEVGNLQKLVMETRRLIAEYETGRARTTSYTKVFFVSQLINGGREELLATLGSGGESSIGFSIPEDVFPMKGAHRIQSLGLAFVFSDDSKEFEASNSSKDQAQRATDQASFSHTREWHLSRLDGFSFSVAVQPPNQWIQRPIMSASEVGVWTGSPARGLPGACQYVNVDPVGEWNLKIADALTSRSGPHGPLNALKNGTNSIWWRVSDIAIYMECEVVS